MPWVEATFKDGKVWAEVDTEGRLVERGGRVAVRYSPRAGATLYGAGVSRVTPRPGVPSVDLPEGVSADDEGAAKPASKGRGSGFGSAGTRSASQASAAKSAAQDLVASFSPDAAVCFTDGACKGNPGPAGAGAVLKLPGGEHRERYRALGKATNNVGELTGVLLALELLDEVGFPATAQAEILSDSQYANGVLTKGWKANVNQELIATIKARLKLRKARMHWIAGHVGVPENERADALANLGVAESSRR